MVAFYGVVPDGAGGTLATVTEYMANGSLRSVLLRKDRYEYERVSVNLFYILCRLIFGSLMQVSR